MSLTLRPAQMRSSVGGGAASGSAWRAYLCVCVLVTGRVRGLLTSAPYFLLVLYNVSKSLFLSARKYTVI